MITKDRRAARDKRHYRLRRHVRGTVAVPRLAVFRSLNHISAQLIDDDTGRTLATADSRTKSFISEHKVFAIFDIYSLSAHGCRYDRLALRHGIDHFESCTATDSQWHYVY